MASKQNLKLNTSPSLRTLALWALFIDSFGYAALGANSRLLNIGFEPMTQVYVRVMVGFLISFVLFRKQIRIQTIKLIPRKDVFWLLMMGVFGYALSVWFITLANLTTKLVNASIIFSTVPFVVYIYSYFLFKEKIKIKAILLLILALYGVAVVSSKSLIPNVSHLGWGELFAFCSVLAAGWWSMGRKKLSDTLNNQEITVLTMLIAAITGMAIALMKGEPLSLHSFTVPTVLIGVGIGAILNILLTFVESFSFKHINAVLGNQILMTSSVFSLILGFVFYHENVSVPEIIGGIFIFISVLWANTLLETD
jgi:drug/metabolite transporter (DMT)-like permease